jgi:GTP-binding protein YchF
MAGLSCGIVGLPNVGKSTLFNAITKAGAEAANYPFCTIEPNVGIVPVPDPRVERLAELVKPQRKLYATIEFVDIAGLVKGASRGEGRGNQFLDNIHHVDLIVHVVRCFESENVVHVDGRVDPAADIATINLELILADIQQAENAVIRLRKRVRLNDKGAQETMDVMERILAHLESEKPLRSMELDKEERKAITAYRFLTFKDVIYAVNVGDDDLPSMANEHTRAVDEIAAAENALVVPICANIEDEIAQLDGDEASLFLEELGLEQSGLDRLIKTSYERLGLITYLTAGELEVRAWTIRKGCLAPQAAAVIHTDFEKGFIRAEVNAFEDIDTHGSRNAAKEAGLMRVEGKEYEVKDGDVVFFRIST